MPKTTAKNTAQPRLSGHQRLTVEQAREILAAAKAPDWQDHMVKNLAHLEFAVEHLLELVDQLTGGEK